MQTHMHSHGLGIDHQGIDQDKRRWELVKYSNKHARLQPLLNKYVQKTSSLSLQK